VDPGETTELHLTLASSAIALDEIVVTGSGVATERRKLGNTVATVDRRTLETAPASNVSELLQGRSPGVSGLPSGGLVGEGARIRIRGTGSLSQSNEPIVYVDGVRVDNGGGFSGGNRMGLPKGGIAEIRVVGIEEILGEGTGRFHGRGKRGGSVSG
jgi:outer membrane cobalamin receptor